LDQEKRERKEKAEQVRREKERRQQLLEEHKKSRMNEMLKEKNQEIA